MTYPGTISGFAPPPHSVIGDAVGWLTGTLLGSVAVTLCILGVAFVGFMMLTGRLPVRHGMRVALGCFVLLGAPAIATALAGAGRNVQSVPPAPPPAPEDERGPLPPAKYDPYAGASLRRD